MHPELLDLEYRRLWTSAVDRRITDALGQIAAGTVRTAAAGIVQGGKRVRPLLVLASTRAAGGDEEQAVGAAAAIEVLHTSSLIHDDIMDQSSLRRGRPAIHIQYGIPTAILAGDALVAIAFRLMQSVNSPRREEIVTEFTTAFLELCEGQALDLGLAGETGGNESEHRRMVERKTAKLFEAAAAIGGMVATADAHIIGALRCFGLHVGMAYQAKDDLLDVAGTERLLGKPTGNDLKNRKKTYLSLAYLQPDANTVPSASALDSVTSTVQEFTDRAVRALQALPDGPARHRLEMLATSLAERRL